MNTLISDSAGFSGKVYFEKNIAYLRYSLFATLCYRYHTWSDAMEGL